MQALPPPPPAIHCIAPELAKQAWGYVVLSGHPAQLDAAIAEFMSGWQLEAKAKSNGIAFARLKHPADITYKELGGLIIKAQQRGLSVSFFTDPPICGIDDQ
jgi:hypothetical protein